MKIQIGQQEQKSREKVLKLAKALRVEMFKLGYTKPKSYSAKSINIWEFDTGEITVEELEEIDTPEKDGLKIVIKGRLK